MSWTAQATILEDQGDGKTHLHAEGADIANDGDDAVQAVDVIVSPAQSDDFFKPGQKITIHADC